MIVHYMDTSVWAKRHAQESGSAWVKEWLGGRPRVACATFGLIEILTVFSRKQRAGDLTEAQHREVHTRIESEFDEMTNVHLTGEVLRRAAELSQTYALRAADMLHLASAIYLRESLPTMDVRFVSSDQELKHAASLARFHVIDPLDEGPGQPAT